MEESVSTLSTKRDKAARTLEFLKAEMTPDVAPIPLDKALASAMLDVYNKRTEFRINIAQAKVANASGTSLAAEVGQYAEKVPGTSLRSVKMSLTGTYSDYASFLAYIEHMRKEHPMSLVYLKVNDLSFEMSLRVFGK